MNDILGSINRHILRLPAYGKSSYLAFSEFSDVRNTSRVVETLNVVFGEYFFNGDTVGLTNLLPVNRFLYIYPRKGPFDIIGYAIRGSGTSFNNVFEDNQLWERLTLT